MAGMFGSSNFTRKIESHPDQRVQAMRNEVESRARSSNLNKYLPPGNRRTAANETDASQRQTLGGGTPRQTIG